MLLVNLQLSKQLKLTNNVSPHYFTNNRVSCALIYIAKPITFFLEDNVLDLAEGL